MGKKVNYDLDSYIGRPVAVGHSDSYDIERYLYDDIICTMDIYLENGKISKIETTKYKIVGADTWKQHTRDLNLSRSDLKEFCEYLDTITDEEIIAKSKIEADEKAAKKEEESPAKSVKKTAKKKSSAKPRKNEATKEK